MPGGLEPGAEHEPDGGAVVHGEHVCHR
jgi:hypothetical protein